MREHCSNTASLRRRRSSWIGWLACMAVVPAAFAAPPPVEAFATLPSVSDVELSPNGNLIAWADRSAAEERAVVFDLQSRSIKHEFNAGTSMKLIGLRWADDDTLLIDLREIHRIQTAAARHTVVSRTLAADVNTGQTRLLLMSNGARAFVLLSHLVAWHTNKPHMVVMSTWDQQRYRWLQMLFEVDTRTGKGAILERGTEFTDDWVVDADENVIARSEWEPGPHYRILAKHGGGWREIYKRDDGSWLELHGVSNDGTAILASGPRDKGRIVLWSIPLDGSGAKVLFEDPVDDVASVYRDRVSGLPLRLSLGGAEQRTHWLEPQAQTHHDNIARAFKDRRVAILGNSNDGKRAIVAADGPSLPVVYYLVDFTSHKADIVGEEYPALADATLGEVRIIRYKARDGVEIAAYLTLPPGTTARELPLVVMPHDGPGDRDYYEFDWKAQFLATRGYAVLRPQYRGSWGFGEAFREAGHHQWGGLMQDDVTDGVKAVVDLGIADPHRVGIVGLGYGGYVALAGAAFTPQLYKCAASVNGVSDLPNMLGALRNLSGSEYIRLAYWSDSIGSAFDKTVVGRSPARAADQIAIPILLIHSEDDTVVPMSQSEKIARGLSELGKPVTLVKLKGEDHWLSRGETRLQMLKEIEKFLAANL
jgi:dienelactone hydrolase